MSRLLPSLSTAKLVSVNHTAPVRSSSPTSPRKYSPFRLVAAYAPLLAHSVTVARL